MMFFVFVANNETITQLTTLSTMLLATLGIKAAEKIVTYYEVFVLIRFIKVNHMFRHFWVRCPCYFPDKSDYACVFFTIQEYVEEE